MSLNASASEADEQEYAPSELSMIAWALATRGDYDPDLMAYIARRSMETGLLLRDFKSSYDSLGFP